MSPVCGHVKVKKPIQHLLAMPSGQWDLQACGYAKRLWRVLRPSRVGSSTRDRGRGQGPDKGFVIGMGKEGECGLTAIIAPHPCS